MGDEKKRAEGKERGEKRRGRIEGDSMGNAEGRRLFQVVTP